MIAAGIAAYVWILPPLVARHIERALAEHGFPHAHVQVARVSLGHVQLSHVTLEDDLEIGAVELDAGISLLWRPRVHQLTLRDVRLSAGAIGRASRPGAPGARGDWPFDVVRIVDGVVAVDGMRVLLSGTIAPAGPAGSVAAVDLVATCDRVTRGATELRDVRATLRSAGPALRACITGARAEVAVEVCGTLPPTLDELRGLRELDATLHAEAPAWQLQGHGTIGWATALVLTAGQVELRSPVLTVGGGTLRGAWLAADVSGSLADLVFEVRGDARADQVELRVGEASASSRGVRAPFAGQIALVAGALQVTPRRSIVVTAREASVRVGDTSVELAALSIATFPAHQMVVADAHLAAPAGLAWSAAAARLGAARFDAPSGTLVARRTLRWRATEAAWRGARFRAPAGVIELAAARRHTATWAAIVGPGSIELGAGELGVHRTRGQWTLDYGRSRALGGELVLDPAEATRSSIDLVVRAHRLELHRLLASFAHGHADGTGLVDGELAIRIDGAGARVERGALRARAGGGLQLSDAAWRARASAGAVGFALHQRIAATLSDFVYAQLALVLQPEGSDPELKITALGRGKRIAQDLDLVINLRGVRDVARRFSFTPLSRSKP